MTLTNPARRERTTPSTLRGRPAPSRVLAVASFGAFLAFLDATVVNIAIPNIRESFPTDSFSALSWVLNAYNIVFAAFLIVFGRIADLVGRRRLLSLGTLLFTLSSVWCAAVPSLAMLVVARLVQALGAAMLVPASLAVVVAAFPAERRNHAVGIWGATAAVAAGLGPPFGGALIELGGWRWAFLVNLPFGIVGLVLAHRTLVESRAPEMRRLPDIRGAVLLAGAVGLLTLGIVQGNDWGWSSVRVVSALAAALLLGAGFAVSSLRHRQPLLDPDLLRIPSFALGNLATFFAGMGFFAYMLTNILWLQYVWRFSVLQAGLALVPSALVAAVTASVLGDVAHRHGYRVILVIASLVWCSAYLWYATIVQPQPDFLRHWLPGQLLSGIGSGAVLPLLGSATLEAVPRGRFATSSAIVSASRQIGGVLGIAVLILIIGAPTPATALTVLRHGWVLSAVCFVLVGLVALAVRRPSREVSESDGAVTPDQIRLHLPAVEAEDGEAALAPYARGSYLDDLPDGLRQRLEHAGAEVQRRAGEWLFREGDAATTMYVLRAGRLEILQGDTVIRELGPGSVLGELALLSGGGLRSASARARRDSVLSEVSRDDFVSAMATAPEAPMAVAQALARALQSTFAREDHASSQASLVAVVGLSPDSPVDHVAAVLDELLADLPVPLRVHRTGELGAEALARAERDNDRVIVVAPWPSAGASTSWWESCRRQADRVVLVAGRGAEPPQAWATTGAQPDLVLVTASDMRDSGGTRPSSQEIQQWSDAVRPDRIITCSEGAFQERLRPLAAAIGGTAVGLVLAGGGARALAHLGVLHELEAAGISVDRVAGTSLGAVVAAAHATGRSTQEVEQVIYEELVRRNPFSDYTVPSRSLIRGRRVEVALRRQLGDTTLIESLPRQFRCVSTDLLARSRHVHRSGVLWEAVVASARIPVFFPPFRQGAQLLVDGGVLDNLPVDLLTERGEGPVIAVNIGSSGAARPVDPNRPPRIPAIGDTLFRTMTIGSGGAVEKARAAGAFVLSPPTMGIGLMEYHQIDRLMEAGRVAARALLDATGGDLWGASSSRDDESAGPSSRNGRNLPRQPVWQGPI